MAWFGDGLPSLSNLKGQLTNFTKEVLHEGIVEEIDERSRALNEANEKCIQLQELLNSKDAEISLLRRQNCELQRTVVELNSKAKESNDVNQDEESEAFFWDPPSAKNRNSKAQASNQKHVRVLQEQLAQATVKIRDLEAELKRIQKVNNSSLKDEIPEGHQKAEFLRAKQDMVNRIIQLEEKTREAERNTKRTQVDETTLVNDFRTVISKLHSLEKMDLIRSALKALETENEECRETNKQEKSDFDEKFKKLNSVDHDSVSLKANFEKRHDSFVESASNKESELHKKIEELEEENKRLFASVEELDQQHGESIEKLLSLKEELEKKHQCLQNAYEQLYVEHNQSQDRVTELESKLASAERNKNLQIETSSQSVQTAILNKRDTDIQTCDLETDKSLTTEVDSIDELTRKIKDILKNCCIDTEPGESIFEAVAKQYVDAKWKKDILEKKVTEVSRDLKEAVEMKDTLQVECDDMQAHIDSLLLEIQDLKLNLPSIPEASEERVASLESETESLHEEVKRLQAENDEIREENSKLRINMQNIETSLRNQESLEAEIRNTKQQLDIAKQQLQGASKNVEDNENMMEDISRRLHASLDENNELRKKVDYLEGNEKQIQDQLQMSLEKCKDLDENIKYIEKLKLELQNAKEELMLSASNTKRLENSVTLLEDAKNEIEKENEDLLEKKEQLELEISKWREISLEKEDNHMLEDLQEELGKAIREKDNLEYDILNMRKELDGALNQADLKECQIMRLSQENENLMKEKDSLIEQLNAVHDESNDKIELLNTEMSLLEQEYGELKQHVISNEEGLIKMKEKLHETEEKYKNLENKFSDANAKAEKLQSENENLQAQLKRYQDLQNELNLKNSTIEELKLIQNEYTQLKKDVEILHSKEKEFLTLQENFSKALNENTSLRNRHETTQTKCQQLEAAISTLQTEKQELLHRVCENATDNEKQQILAILDEKVRENDNLKSNNDKLMSEIIESQNKIQEIMEANNESADMAKQTIESLSHLIKERDEEIKTLKADLGAAKNTSVESSEVFTTLKNERDELVKLVTVKHNESLQYHGEIQKLTQILNDQNSRIQNLMAEQSENSSLLAQKNADLLWTRNELQVLQQRLKNLEESENNTETCRIMEHSTQTAEISILNEKCNALEAALIQEQSNNRMLQNQLNESQNKETNAARELERLRTHLVEMESSYTEEALIAEETRKELEAKLLQAEEKMKNSSTVYTSASIRANQQVETLQQQMALIVQQRHDIQNKLTAAEHKVLSQTASLTNLQIVLEQFQQDKDRDILAATERIQAKLHESYKRQEELTQEVVNLKEQLAEAKECLQAASRLSEQLDKKTERIEQLGQEVERLTDLVNTADRRIEEAKQSGEGKVDKTLIKNLFLGYLSSSAADKSSVLRVFATILDFNETERDKAGLNTTNSQNSWFSRLSSGSSISNKDQETSLSAAFVRFLESESKPKPQLPALPIQTSPLPRPGHSRQHSTSSTQSALLLSNVNLPTFPDFIPARNTGSILKEVLKDS